MDFTEIIGFIIVLFVLLLPLLRKLLIDKKRVEQKKEEETFIEEEEELVEPPPAPQIIKQSRPSTERLVKRNYEFETDLEAQKLQSKIPARELETHIPPEFRERIVSENFILKEIKKKRKEPRLVSLVKKRNPRKAMIILAEILNRKGE